MSKPGEHLQRHPHAADDADSPVRPKELPVATRPLHSDARALTPRADRPDPFARVRSMGERQNRLGMTVGLMFALTVHGAGAVHGLTSLLDLGAFAALVQSTVRDDVRATYAVEVAPPKPPPPPPEEATKPEPEPPQARVPSRNQAEAPPPSPAQAGKVLTASADPDAPLDLTGDGFVTGDGDRYVGGVTSAKGTATSAVHRALTKPEGKVGGTGNGKPDAALTKPDRSRAPGVVDTNWDDCGFPPEADTEQINFMRVRVVVTVGLDGRAQKVTVLNDPGHGFGRLAQQCAYRKAYGVGLDVDGKAIVSTTPPIAIRFQR